MTNFSNASFANKPANIGRGFSFEEVQEDKKLWHGPT